MALRCRVTITRARGGAAEVEGAGEAGGEELDGGKAARGVDGAGGGEEDVSVKTQSGAERDVDRGDEAAWEPGPGAPAEACRCNGVTSIGCGVATGGAAEEAAGVGAEETGA
jgi:hypothetical protein